MPLPKPAVIPRWADTPGRRIEPTEGRKDSGWFVGDIPPAEHFNWLWGYGGDWWKWLAERVDDGIGPSPETQFLIKNPDLGTPQLKTMVTSGVQIHESLNVGFEAASGIYQAVSVGDIDFRLTYNAAAPSLMFSAGVDLLRCNRAAHRFEWLADSVVRATIGPVGLRVGQGDPVYPLHVDEIAVGTLGGIVGDMANISSMEHLSDDTVDLLTYGYRNATGTDWTTASTYIHYGAEAGAERHGFVRFSGSAVSSVAHGIGAHVGIGSGAFGSEPALFVDAANVYVHALLPRTAFGLGAPLSVIGSSARPWSTIWMRDSSGTDAHINATGSGGPGKLTLEVFDGVLTRGRIKLVGSETIPYLDCYSVGYLKAPGVHATVHSGNTPVETQGFGFRNDSDVWDVTGLFYAGAPTALRIWKQNRRMVDIAGRVGNIDDVQFTLGRGSGPVGSPPTVADLREYACVCQDFLSQDTIARGDLVRVSAAADQSVVRTAVLGDAGAVGFAVDDIANGAVGRIATSGVVIARSDGAPGVTRGNYVQASGVTGRVQNLTLFGPACVGIALKTVGADSYFPLLIRFGG